MTDATISIHLDEFQDELAQTVDELVARHGHDIAAYLQSFLIGVATVRVTTTDGRRFEWPC